MTISDLLTQVANTTNDNLLMKLIESQPTEIKCAIQANDCKKFKSCITNKQYFANDCTVTTY
ncbi:MAG: hypothetical protein JO149_04535 [Gammaproteobacteria bacterium]|nr:hypothetical protein [Gammaproteobacteria bacterium]